MGVATPGRHKGKHPGQGRCDSGGNEDNEGRPPPRLSSQGCPQCLGVALLRGLTTGCVRWGGGKPRGRCQGSGGDGTGHILITAAMIKRELARECQHKNKEYRMNGIQLSITRRNGALRSALAREGKLVDLLEKDALGAAGC